MSGRYMKLNSIKLYKGFTDEFCIKMCKYFADKSFIKELDNQLYSNDSMYWLIGEDLENSVLGFLSIEDKDTYYYLDNFYILPRYRNMKIGNEILDYSLDYFGDKPIKLLTRNVIALNMYLKNGFKIYKQNGRYKYLIRNI